MLYTVRFFSPKCSLFHNANLFGSYIFHILYAGCAKIKKKNNSGAKGLMSHFIPRIAYFLFSEGEVDGAGTLQSCFSST